MSATVLAKAIKRAGIPVLDTHEPDDEMDGEIKVSGLVAVQVPFPEDGRPFVVAELSDGTFKTYPERRSPDALVADLLAAL